MLVRNLQKKGDYQMSILSQDENLRLAIQNDQNVADAVKKAQAGIRPDLTAKQNRIPEQVLTDVLEIKEKAMNNLRSIFTEEQAKKFLNGDGRTPPLTQDDLEYLNVFWEDLKPVLLSKTGLSLKFFRDILKKSTAGRRANYGFYTGRTTAPKSFVINTTEELLKTLPPIDMLRAANKRAASIGQTIPEGAILSKDLSKLIGNFPTSGDKRLLKIPELTPLNQQEYYMRFADIFQGYDPNVEKWKKANMKDDMDFINDIRNLIPDMTDFEKEIKLLYEDLMAERKAMTIAFPVPVPTVPVPTVPVPTVAEAKDELQEPLPDMKGEIIQQDAKETLPTIPEPKFVNMVDPQFYKEEEPEPLEGETTLDALTRVATRQSGELTTLLEGDDRTRAEERNAALERLKRNSKAQLAQDLMDIPLDETPIKRSTSGGIEDAVWVRLEAQAEQDRRAQEATEAAILRNRQIRAQRLEELAPILQQNFRGKKATRQQDMARLEQERLDEENKELELLLKAQLSTMAENMLLLETKKLYDAATQRLDKIDDAITQKRNNLTVIKVAKARKREEAELRQMEEERRQEQEKATQLKEKGATLIQKVVRGKSAQEGLRKTKAEIKAEFKELIKPMEFSDDEMRGYTSYKREQLQEDYESEQDSDLRDFFEKYPYLTDKEIKTYQKQFQEQREKDRLSNERRQAESTYEMGLLQKAQDEWEKLGKSISDLEYVEFMNMLPMRYKVDQWDNEIEDFIQEEKDRQAMEELGMDLGEQKRQFEKAMEESAVLDDIQRNARQTLDSYSEDQLRILFAQRAATRESVEETAVRLSGELLPTPPKRRPTPSRPRLASRQPSMDIITEMPEPEPSPRRPPTPIRGNTPSKSRVPVKTRLVEPEPVEPTLPTKEELTDEMTALKRTRPRKEEDKLAKKTRMAEIQSVLDSGAFNETPMSELEQRFQIEGTAPKRPMITPRLARTPEQRRQAEADAKAAEAVRVPTPSRRAPTPPTRLDTPTKARVPVKTTQKTELVDELIARAEVIVPKVENLARKRPTPNRARPAEEREGDREMADAQKRRQQSMEDMLRRDAELQTQELQRRRRDPIREQAQADAELFLARNLVRSGVANESVNTIENLLEQKKNEGTITAKKAQRSPYSTPDRVAQFQEVAARLERQSADERQSRISDLLATRESRASDAQAQLEREQDQRRNRLSDARASLEPPRISPRISQEAIAMIEERRASSVGTARPRTAPTDAIRREQITDFKLAMKEKEAGVPIRDSEFVDFRELMSDPTRLENWYRRLQMTPEDEVLFQFSRDYFKKGRGLKAKPKTFIEFGKFKLNENMLEEGTLQVKTANGSPIPAFSKKIAISDTLQSILMDLIETKKLRGVSDLDDDERRLIETLIIKAGLAHGLGVKKVHQSDEDGKKVKRFDLVKGIYDAGNNSVEVIHELRSLILYFIKTKRLDRKSGIEALQELQ